MKTVKEVLIAAKSKISNHNNWTTGALARNANGKACHITDPNATCFCSIGALIICTKGFAHTEIYYEALDILSEFTGVRVSDFNDTHTHQDVIEAFDKAIEIAK